MFIAITSCCSLKNNDFSYNSEYTSLYKCYQLGDTIYFADNNQNLDAITITKIDSSSICGGVLGTRRKQVTVETQYLNDDTISQNIYELIVVEKFPNSKTDEYFVGIRYLNFVGELNINEKKKGNLLINLGITDYWIIPTSLPENNVQPNTITSIYWTNKYGLTAYYKFNGEFYTLLIN